MTKLTPTQYAKKIGKSRITIYRWIKSGKIPPKQILREKVERLYIILNEKGNDNSNK